MGGSLSWLERLHGMQEVVGSTPILSTPEFLKFVKFIKFMTEGIPYQETFH